MTEGEPWIAVKFGCYAAGVHLSLASFNAIMVAAGDSSSGELWIYIGLLDTPMNLLLLPLLNHLPRFDLWPRIGFLPGHLGSWDFLFCFVYFVLLGTAFWFFIGWLFGRLTHRLRYGVWRTQRSAN